MRSVCVFCGSSAGNDPAYADAARRLGNELAARGLRLVYGGASVGLMGTVADAALGAGGEVIGVIPRHLMAREVAHAGLADLRVTESMHERKATMGQLADGFVALPGGLGTLEELSEVLTWSQLHIHAKPCGLYDVCGFYGPLLAFFEHAVTEGFLRSGYRHLVVHDTDPGRLLDRMADWRPLLAPSAPGGERPPPP